MLKRLVLISFDLRRNIFSFSPFGLDIASRTTYTSSLCQKSLSGCCREAFIQPAEFFLLRFWTQSKSCEAHKKKKISDIQQIAFFYASLYMIWRPCVSISCFVVM